MCICVNLAYDGSIMFWFLRDYSLLPWIVVTAYMALCFLGPTLMKDRQ